MRNAAPLRALLRGLPSQDGYHCRAAAVALGALGVAVAPGEVLHDACDRDGLNAYATAIGLRPLTPAARRARLAALAPRLAPGLGDRHRELVRRAGGGDTVTMATCRGAAAVALAARAAVGRRRGARRRTT